MQAMLKQTGPLPNARPTRPRLFSGQAARLIAAGAAGTALFLGTTLYQTYELNRLRKSTQPVGHTTVQVDSARTITTDTPQITQSDAPPVVANSPDGRTETAQAIVRDTVYIDRYIRVPVAAAPDRTDRLAHTPNPVPGQSAESTVDRESAVGRSTSLPQQRSGPTKSAQTANRLPDAAEPTTVADNQPALAPRSKSDGSAEYMSTGQPGSSDLGSRSRNQPSFPAGQSTADRAGNRPESAIGSRNTTRTGRGQRADRNADTGSGSTGSLTPATNESVVGRTESAISRTETATTGHAQTSETASTAGESTGSAAISAEPIQVQPVQLGSIAWEQRLLHRSRGMRPARTVVVGGPTIAKSSSEQSAPEKPERQSTPSLVKVRIGAGSDLNGRLWSVGVYAELLAGRHVTLSIGLSRASFDNGKYITEGLFNQQYQQGPQGPQGQNFRREFGLEKRVDPRHEIININLQTIRLVMPLTIGYRLPINSSFAITPTLGTILNLQSQEQVSYIIRRPPSMPPYGGYSSEYSSDADCQSRTVSILNNVMLGATVEWQRKHWGLQAGPILTIAAQPDPDWTSSLSGGLRARAFFQF